MDGSALARIFDYSLQHLDGWQLHFASSVADGAQPNLNPRRLGMKFHSIAFVGTPLAPGGPDARGPR